MEESTLIEIHKKAKCFIVPLGVGA
ncbi:MAG: hypothetical protein SV062_03160, partial [Thermodesulfobacteriota bacterium]|nr:hypothetical protein [Thermodesulfobacteriota bacterium]